MLTEEDSERIHITLWSGFVLGYGFALGVLMFNVTITLIAAAIFALIWSVTH
jgi:hypothetical protein